MTDVPFTRYHEKIAEITADESGGGSLMINGAVEDTLVLGSDIQQGDPYVMQVDGLSYKSNNSGLTLANKRGAGYALQDGSVGSHVKVMAVWQAPDAPDVPPLAQATWEQIAAVSEWGEAAKHWKIGDEKDIQLTTGETLTLQIYDFDHDDLADGSGKAGITFGMKNLMANEQGNASTTNVGGFTSSNVYAWLTGTLYNQLPTDLRAVVKTINKKTSAGNKSSTININSMNVF